MWPLLTQWVEGPSQYSLSLNHKHSPKHETYLIHWVRGLSVNDIRTSLSLHPQQRLQYTIGAIDDISVISAPLPICTASIPSCNWSTLYFLSLFELLTGWMGEACAKPALVCAHRFWLSGNRPLAWKCNPVAPASSLPASLRWRHYLTFKFYLLFCFSFVFFVLFCFAFMYNIHWLPRKKRSVIQQLAMESQHMHI